jgi:hypothetical protein
VSRVEGRGTGVEGWAGRCQVSGVGGQVTRGESLLLSSPRHPTLGTRQLETWKLVSAHRLNPQFLGETRKLSNGLDS